jgi:putative ABC transport system substrate-binding protein
LPELIALKVDVLITAGTPAALAAKKATATVPIVMAAVGDAVDSGIVPSLARPAGNITGLSTLYTQLEGKRNPDTHELVPKLKHIALLANPANPFTDPDVEIRACRHNSRHLATHVMRSAPWADFDKVFAAIAKSKPDAMAVSRRPAVSRIQPASASWNSPRKTPAGDVSVLRIHGRRRPGFLRAEFPECSGAPPPTWTKSSRAPNPPICRSSSRPRFEFIINAKTAKALGLTIPQSLVIQRG